MPMVVTQLCAGCKFKDCIVVCPADCFYEGETMLYINPDQCIDCGLCAPECPQQAIFYDDRVPLKWLEDIALNRQMSHECPRVTHADQSAGRSSSAQS